MLFPHWCRDLGKVFCSLDLVLVDVCCGTRRFQCTDILDSNEDKNLLGLDVTFKGLSKTQILTGQIK